MTPKARHTRRNGKPNIALIFGAGASVPLGYPTTAEILPAIWRDLGQPRRAVEWRETAVKVRRNSDTLLRSFIQHAFPALTRNSRLHGGSIIDVLSLLDQLIADGRTPGPLFNETELRDVRTLLAVAMNGVLQGDKNQGLRKRMAAWLLRATTRCDRVTVISTNYDIAYELPLYRLLRDRDKSIVSEVDMGISYRTPDCRLHHRPREAKLAILKLHGSLNWLQCEVCAQIFINHRQRIATLEFWKKLRTHNQCICDGRLRSMLVTPSFVRNVRDAHLLSIWNAAVNELREADQWIFVGYSLPMEDTAIRHLLLRAYHARRRKPLRVRLATWDPGAHAPDWPQDLQASVHGALVAAATRQRYEAVFSEQHFNRTEDYFPRGVEQLVTALEREL